MMFEGSTASGAERAYRKAVDKLTELLVAEGALHAVRLKQKSKTKRKKKIAAAIYEYQADCDGEWSEIQVDFENGTAEIVWLADWDTIKNNRFANKAVAYRFTILPVLLTIPVFLLLGWLIPCMMYDNAAKCSVVEQLRDAQ